MKVALLTVSGPGSGGQVDLSGHILHKLLAEGGVTVVRAETVEHDREAISSWLCRAADVLKVDLALTSGGTGLGVLDVTPEATQDALDFEVPGIAEAIRATGLSKTPLAMLSRGVAGVRRQTLIVNLSGSPRTVTEQWSVIKSAVEFALEDIRRSTDDSKHPPSAEEGSSSGGVDSKTLGGHSSFVFDSGDDVK